MSEYCTQPLLIIMFLYGKSQEDCSDENMIKRIYRKMTSEMGSSNA